MAAWTDDDVEQFLKTGPQDPPEVIEDILQQQPFISAFDITIAALRILLRGKGKYEYTYNLGELLSYETDSMSRFIAQEYQQGNMDAITIKYFVEFAHFPGTWLRNVEEVNQISSVRLNYILDFWGGFTAARTVMDDNGVSAFDSNIGTIGRLVGFTMRPDGDGVEVPGSGKDVQLAYAKIAAALHKSNGDVAKAAALLRLT